MLSLSQLLTICLVLKSVAECSVPRSGTSVLDNGPPNGLLFQTRQNATLANEDRTQPQETTLDGNWLEEADIRTLMLQPVNEPSLNATAVGLPEYRCDGKAFGRNLNRQSCLEAVNSMRDLHLPQTWGRRGEEKFDINLPFRFLSNNGLCAIDVSLRKGVDFDTMIPNDMIANVRALIDICIRVSPNEGGIVSNLGQNGALAARVVPYRPNVQCGDRGTAPPPMACRAILDEMPTSDMQQRFGPVEDPTAQVVVPKRYTTRDRGCGYTTDAIGGTDVADWYKLWAAGVAVEVMCVEYRKAVGIAIGLGKERKLFVALEKISPKSISSGVDVAQHKHS